MKSFSSTTSRSTGFEGLPVAMSLCLVLLHGKLSSRALSWGEKHWGKTTLGYSRVKKLCDSSVFLFNYCGKPVRKTKLKFKNSNEWSRVARIYESFFFFFFFFSASNILIWVFHSLDRPDNNCEACAGFFTERNRLCVICRQERPKQHY